MFFYLLHCLFMFSCLFFDILHFFLQLIDCPNHPWYYSFRTSTHELIIPPNRPTWRILETEKKETLDWGPMIKNRIFQLTYNSGHPQNRRFGFRSFHTVQTMGNFLQKHITIVLRDDEIIDGSSSEGSLQVFGHRRK